MTHAETRIIGYGFAASVVVHVLVFVGVGVWMGTTSFSDLPKVLPPPVEEEPSVTLLFPDAVEMMPEAPPVEPEQQPQPQKPSERYIRTTQNKESEKAPEKADFVSDRDTVASAKLAPAPGGTEPMPSMNGVSISTTELTNRDYKDGEIKEDSTMAPPPLPPSPPSVMEPSPPVPPAPKPAPAPPPELELKTPDPEPPSKTMEIAKKEDSPAELKMKELDAVLKDKSESEHLPLEVRPPSEMSEQTLPEATPVPPPAIPVPEMSVPKAQPVEEPLANAPDPKKDTFQPQTRTSEVKGTISNIGSEDAVNAMATPTGRYMRRVTSAIEKKWHFLRREKQDFVEPGKLRLKFYVNKDGQAEDISIIFNEANAVLTDFTLTAILKAELPPIPPDLLPILEKERVEIEYDVVIY